MDVKAFLKQNRWPLIIAALAVVVRIIYLLELSRSPEAMVPMVDEKWHWLWANEIVSESFWGVGTFFRAPLYPYFLAFLSWITGGSILASKILQVILCGGTAWFIYKLADNLFDRRAGIAAGLVYALYGTLVMYETMLLIPVIFLFLTVWGIYRLVAYQQESNWRTWLMTGLILGLATIARPNIL
ncbi:MAG: glycosyltransferase family 39 protein, partial [candidate division Zixibacteria bacterium]